MCWMAGRRSLVDRTSAPRRVRCSPSPSPGSARRCTSSLWSAFRELDALCRRPERHSPRNFSLRPVAVRRAPRRAALSEDVLYVISVGQTDARPPGSRQEIPVGTRQGAVPGLYDGVKCVATSALLVYRFRTCRRGASSRAPGSTAYANVHAEVTFFQRSAVGRLMGRRSRSVRRSILLRTETMYVASAGASSRAPPASRAPDQSRRRPLPITTRACPRSRRRRTTSSDARPTETRPDPRAPACTPLVIVVAGHTKRKRPVYRPLSRPSPASTDHGVPCSTIARSRPAPVPIWVDAQSSPCADLGQDRRPRPIAFGLVHGETNSERVIPIPAMPGAGRVQSPGSRDSRIGTFAPGTRLQV